MPADDIERVITACPDNDWRLVFALPRYAGVLVVPIFRRKSGAHSRSVSSRQWPLTFNEAREKSLDMQNGVEKKYPRQGSNL